MVVKFRKYNGHEHVVMWMIYFAELEAYPYAWQFKNPIQPRRWYAE